MQHIQLDRLYEIQLGERSFTDEELYHLAQCISCQTEREKITDLVNDLRMASSAEPSTERLDLYVAIFDDYGPQRRGLLQRIADTVVASLVIDSRMQPSPLATRSVRTDRYRLMYETPNADIELYVEEIGQLRNMQGDVITDTEETDADTALVESMLVQLLDKDSQEIRFETETDDDGRFGFHEIPTGMFKLMITSSSQEVLEIQDLAIS